MRSEPRVAALQPPRDLAQHGVAGGVPVDVVDALEVSRRRRARSQSSRRRSAVRPWKQIREVAAVEESRQRVDAREPLEAADRLGALLLGRRCAEMSQVDPLRNTRRRLTVIRARSRTQRTTPSSPDEAVALLDDLAVQAAAGWRTTTCGRRRRDRRGGRGSRRLPGRAAGSRSRPSSAAIPGPCACWTYRPSGSSSLL